MDLSIVIVNWNSSGYLRECLKSVFRYTRDIEFEIVVLDNASFDGCGQMLANEFPQVLFIQSEQNLGFAQGNNLAASASRGDVLLFLNPDTEIRSPALNTLYDSVISLPEAGTVGARLLNTDGTMQTSCLQAFPTISNQLLDADLLRITFPGASIWGVSPLFTEGRAPSSVEGISGACLMTHRHVFQNVGGFSEDYFMYFEDMDYCLKVVRAGWRNYFIPDAKVVHHGGKSSGGSYSQFSIQTMTESAWRFFCKHMGHRYAQLFRVGLAAKAVSRSCLLTAASLIPCGVVQRQSVKAALRKWLFVLKWCLGA